MTYKITEEIIDDIVESTNIINVISEYIDLKRTGSNYKGLCPFHNEKTPSFMVNESKQIYHCFGCGEGGNTINFIMKYLNLGFVEALKLLADKAGIALEEKKKSLTENDKKKLLTYKINRAAAIYFYNNIKNNKTALNYLINRGIDYKVIKAFGLGYADNDWNSLQRYLIGKGYTEAQINESGLIISRKDNNGYYDRFRNRIIFPIINTKNKVIGFGGRVLDDSQPKYLNSPETIVFNKGNNLYGLNNIRKYNIRKDIILVEGYMDVISLFRFGIKCGVASLGTALTQKQANKLKRYSKDIYICYDSDLAGQNATNKAIDILRKEGINPKIILLNQSKDPDEHLLKFGVDSFMKLKDNAISYFDFKITYLKRLNNINTTEGKINFTKQVSEIIKTYKSPIEKDVYISKIARETNISVEAIKREVYGYSKNKATTSLKDKYIKSNNRNNKDRIVPVKLSLDPGVIDAEKNLLNLLLKDENVYNKIKDVITPNDFTDKVYKKLAEIIYDNYLNDKEIDLNYILTLFNDDSSEKIKEVYIINNELKNEEKNRAVEDYLKKINFNKLLLEKNRIRKKLKELENINDKNTEDNNLFNKLCSELILIDKELKLHQKQLL